MIIMTSVEAQNNFGKLLDTVQREPVAITRHGRPAASRRRSRPRCSSGASSSVVPEIVDTAAAFLRGRRVRFDALVPVPPSNKARKRQPVIAVAKALSDVLGVPVCEGCVTKTKSTAQLKDVFDFAKRTEILTGAFTVDVAKTTGKRLLLFDDLYRSGATVNAITTLLLTTGAAGAVYLLTLTQTRKLA